MPNADNFTFLRLVAAFFVLFSHSYSLVGAPEPWAATLHYGSFGKFGVNIFFVISGYLLTTSLARNPNALRYAVNRTARIVPGLTVMLVVTVVAGSFLTSSSSYWSENGTWRYLTTINVFDWQPFLPGVFENNKTSVVNGSLWTLMYEVTCYAILLACSRSTALFIPAVVGFVAVGFFVLMDAAIAPDAGLYRLKYKLLAEMGIYFGIGALWARYGFRHSVAMDFSMAIIAVVAIVSTRYGWHFWLAAQIVVVPYFVLRVATGYWAPVSSRISNHDISYGMYIYAFPIQQIIIQAYGRSIDPMLLTLVALFVVVPVAAISWFAIERPSMNMLRKLVSTPSPEPAAANAEGALAKRLVNDAAPITVGGVGTA